MTVGTVRTLLVMGSILLVLAAVWWWSTGAGVPNDSAASRSLATSDTIPAFTNLDGDTIDLTDQLTTDGPLIVTSWASWCPVCGEQLETLQATAGTYRGEVTIVAVNRQERSNHAKSFLQTVDDISAVTVVLDPADRFYQDISGYTIPETVVYDNAGSVIAHFHGIVTVEELLAVLP